MRLSLRLWCDSPQNNMHHDITKTQTNGATSNATYIGFKAEDYS